MAKPLVVFAQSGRPGYTPPPLNAVNVTPITSPDARRALDALDRAVAVAESGRSDRPIELVGLDDFRVATAAQLSEVRARLDRVLMGANPDAGLDALLTSGALDALLPEIKALVGFGDGEWRHKDVWRHTKQVVLQATPRLEIRWGALLHDIGKVKTRSISPDGEVHFFGHAEVGARMFDRMERRLRLFAADDPLRDTVRFLILHHLRPAGYDASWTDSAVRRFGKELGSHLEALLCLARADITTKRPEKKRRGLRNLDELNERIVNIQTQDAVQPLLPSGIGDVLMKEFNIPPSRLIGDIKRALEGAIEAGELTGYQPAEFYVEHVGSHRERYGLK
ncbi:MAG: HDIG domain-containing protein [Polyangiaceae bacterium]